MLFCFTHCEWPPEVAQDVSSCVPHHAGQAHVMQMKGDVGENM